MEIDITKNQGQSMKMRSPRRMRIFVYSDWKIFRDWDNVSIPQV
jgi:hypothetical protein